MDLIPNGLKSVSVAQMGLFSVDNTNHFGICYSYQIQILATCLLFIKSVVQSPTQIFFFCWCNLRQKRNAIVSEISGTFDVTLGWSSAGLCSGSAKKNIRGGDKFVDVMKFLDAAPLNSFTLRSASFRLRLLTKHSSLWGSSCCFTKSNKLWDAFHFSPLFFCILTKKKNKKKQPHTKSVVLHVLVCFRWSHSCRSIDCNRLVSDSVEGLLLIH